MTAITAEARFITLCVREREAVRAGEVRSAALAVRDWEAVVQMAARHRVAAFVQQAAAREAAELPAPARDALHLAALAALAHVMLLDRHLPRLAEMLAAAAVPAIVLKGPALVRAIYPSSALRPYADIDLTVQDRHEAAAAAVLAAAGFEEVPCGAGEAQRAHTGHVHEAADYHRMFMAEGGRVLVELHVDPLQLGLRPRCEQGRWQRAVPVPELPGLLMLCPEDQVVQLSVHAHKHGFDRLIWLKDLDLLLRAYGDTLDWALVARVARQEGVRASVWLGLRLARQLLGAPAPAAVLALLRPAPLVRVLYGLVWPTAQIADLGGKMRRRAVQFHAADSWRGMLPSLILQGRRQDRARAVLRAVLHH